MSSILAWTIAFAFLAVLSGSATAQARLPFRVGGLTCSTGARVDWSLARGRICDVFSLRAQRDNNTSTQARSGALASILV